MRHHLRENMRLSIGVLDREVRRQVARVERGAHHQARKYVQTHTVTVIMP